MTTASQLAVDIARCELMAHCLGTDESHPCGRVTREQWKHLAPEERLSSWKEHHQLPEPWMGHLDTAPILFISSNPSIAGTIDPSQPVTPAGEQRIERYPSSARIGQWPRWYWTDEEIVDRFDAAFDVHIEQGIRSRHPDGIKVKHTAFWSAVKKRAEELLPDRPVEPGTDYALTEVVHCKTRSEIGVAEALGTCSARYLHRVLEASPATVLVVLGTHARQAVRNALSIREHAEIVGPVEIAGRDRMVAFLPHPNHRGVRSFAGCHPEAEIARLRSWLTE